MIIYLQNKVQQMKILQKIQKIKIILQEFLLLRTNKQKPKEDQQEAKG